MKKSKFLWLSLILALIMSVSAVTAFAAGEPTLTVKTTSLELENAVYMNFKIQSENISDTSSVKLLVWESYPGEYIKGTEDAELSVMRTEAGTGYLVFQYTDLAAKDMTKFVYVCAYAKVNGEDVYSKPTKFSIVQYAYNTQTNASAAANLKALVSNMLMYGASAQTYFNYKTDFLATDPIVKIRTEGGTHADGFKTGYYKVGTEITLTANAPEEGYEFSHWENSYKDIVGTDMALTLKAYTDETYTAVYEEKGGSSAPNPEPEKTYSEGLVYTLGGNNYNGYYYIVSDIGTCTDARIMIPDTYDAGDAYGALPVKEIGANAFAGCWRLTSVIIPESVVYIRDSAFSGCSSLTGINIPNGVTSIDSSAFEGCSSLTSINIPNGVTSIGSSTFSGCSSLTSINIPNAVTSIDSYAFQDCSSLTDIRYGGTTAKWKSVSLGSMWKYNVPAKKIICANGEVAI